MSAVRSIRVAEGVESFAARTPTLPPATHTNSYFVGCERLLIVEPATPYEDEQRAFLEEVHARIAAGARVEALFLTHHHIDHVGGLPRLSDALGAPVWAHRATAERLCDSAPDGASVHRVIEDGEVIDLGDRRVLAVHTPGHAPGHLCLQDADAKWMIAGDMVASMGTILVDARVGDMRAYLDSLARMRSLAPAVLLPAHGAPIVDADARLAHYVAHRLARETKVVRALEATGRAASIDELVGLAYADASPAVWPIARLSLEAHLLKLEADGRAVRTDGFWRLS